MTMDFLHLAVAFILLLFGIGVVRWVALWLLAVVFRTLRMPAGYYLTRRLLHLGIGLGLAVIAIGGILISTGAAEPGPQTSVWVTQVNRAWTAFGAAVQWVIDVVSGWVSR